MKLIELIMILIAIESGGDDRAIGDNGKAYGCLQIHAVMVTDFNRISGKRYSHGDAFDRSKSIEIAQTTLTHYKKHIERSTGRKACVEDLARIWNGGGSAWKPQRSEKEKALQRYFSKVLDEHETRKRSSQ